MQQMPTVQLGDATISVMNVGDFTWTLAETFNVPEHEWRPGYEELFTTPLLFPTQCIHIALPGASILVDPCRHDGQPDPAFVPPQYQQPPDLLTQLLARGIDPNAITHLIITHTHIDHYAGVTREYKSQVVPCFPNARCLLNQADWEMTALQHALLDPTSLESRTLGVLWKAGMLEIIEGDVDLLPHVQIMAAPGETRGHQIVRVYGQRQTLSCVGDLYHHWIEIEHPTWMTRWSDYATKVHSRQRLMETLKDEQALLVAAHVPIGCIEHTPLGPKWRELDTCG